MWWSSQEDEYRIPGDIPRSRRTLIQVSTKFNIYFFCAISLMSGFLGIVGILGTDEAKMEAELSQLSDEVGYLFVGLGGFCLFFPFFLILYVARHLLRSIIRLETEVAELKALINPSSSELDCD